MPEADDIQLLRDFTVRQSDAAFAALVTRYVNLVYSVALRQTGNPHATEEITQAVFIILARKAASLGPKTVLSGWLYQTARLTAANYRRTEFRRARREQEAHMQSVLNEPERDLWPQIAPLLDDALGKLGEKDRHAIVLRFFENKSLGEVGAALGASEDAAKMRVNRALERLRKFFSQRGLMLPAAAIAGAVSANSVHAAPMPLAATVSTVGLGKVAVSTSAAVLLEATLKQMLWLKLRTALAVVLGVSLLGVAVALQQQHQASMTDVVKFKLLGTPGLPFEVAYSTNGQPQTVKGVLPREVSFHADAFNATIHVQGPGEFGFEVYRGDLRKAFARPAHVGDTLTESIEGKAGGVELALSGKSIQGGRTIADHKIQTSDFHSTAFFRFVPSSNSAPRAAAGPAVIKIKLLGTSGLPFEVNYSADGQPQTAKGMLPDEVSFSADEFSAIINVQGPGEFGFELYRGDLQQTSAGVARIPKVRSLLIEGKKGGAGISVRPN